MVQGGYVSQSKGQLTVNKKPNVLNKAKIAGHGGTTTTQPAAAAQPVTNNGNGNVTADNTANNNQQQTVVVSGVSVKTNFFLITYKKVLHI